VSPMSLVGSLTFPFYLAAMRRPDLADDPRFLTPELRELNYEALHGIVQTWIRTFDDMATLDAQFDEAKIATGQLRDVAELADSEWAQEWGATREVADSAGGRIRIPGAPWHFSADTAEPVPQHPACQGEHNAEILKELGFDDATIADLTTRAALIQPSRLG
jgi:crotonobetainyl-CoA:carnitine CoA-transferase CaiB-like acyl-CoA transferase